MPQKYITKLDYKVFVRTITYNHALYIKENLDGVAMQQTDFPFVHFVIDDASTDGEQDTILSWLNENCDMEKVKYINHPLTKIIIANNKRNANCTHAIYLLKQNLYKRNEEKIKMYQPWREHCEYEALCEGDDYWTDSRKLQKEVIFLDSHSDYMMCFHSSILHWEDGSKSDEVFKQIEDREYTGEELFKQWTAATASVMLRSNIVLSDTYLKAQNNKTFIYGDIVTWLSAAHIGKIWGMSDVMSVYRRQESGAVFGYDLNRIKKQAYHSLEIYKVFGMKYKELSKQKFFQYAQEAFFGQKANGKIDYPLLLDLIKYTPIQTFKKLVSMVFDKILK